MPSKFEVTWDYLCPFARNAHEHLVAALQAGAGWETRFRFFSLAQAHTPEGQEPVWSEPTSNPGVLAGFAGIVVRDRYPENFFDAHLALFSARHDESKDLRDPAVVEAALNGVGLDGAAIVDEARGTWPAEVARKEHEESVQRWDVFGVPTFIADEKAVFVRLMHRPGGDAKLAERSIERVLDLVDEYPELNEYKFTRVGR
ncbi:MAG TPA: DsbA family protein [Acidimicrobiales bacterium]|nr:DsbA family protein [Acidimicrobiales bacterium]